MLVSVIIPLYNREKYIEKAVDSVLNQTYQELEVIVVDDCSTDNSVNVVKRIQERDKRVKLVCCKENGGACKARNIGIDHAQGELIAFQDSDDYWHEDKLEKSIKALDSENVDFVFCALSREENVKGKVKKEIIPVFDLNTEEDKLSRLLIQNYVSTQTIVAKKEVFNTVRFDERFPRFQDWELTIQVLQQQFTVYYINESLVDSYVLTDSISYNGKKALIALELMEQKYKVEYDTRPLVYKRFCERAAYLVEMSGCNGSDYFMKSFKIEKKISILFKYILTKLRLYWPMNVLLCIIRGN